MGDLSSFLAIVIRGEVSVLSPSGPGSAQLSPLASLVAQDSFGGGSLLDGAPRAAAVLTVLECELAVLTRRDYLAAMAQRDEDDAATEAEEAEVQGHDGAGDDSSGPAPLLSLLDPAFAAESALPPNFSLTPHLQTYISIMTSR